MPSRLQLLVGAGLAGAAAWWAASGGSSSTAELPAMRPPLAGVRAIVVGATGACGKFAVDGLVRSPSTEAVTAVVRRHHDFASEFGWSLADAKKLSLHVVENFDRLRDTADAWKGHTVAVCALGTTRHTAGGADGFVKVDRDYVVAAAELAKSAGVDSFSLLTAQGSTGVPSWLPRSLVKAVHPLLYTQTKHEAEAAVLGQGFHHVSIFRPGLLDRRVPGADSRLMERALLGLVPSTHASVVGHAMAEDATTALPEGAVLEVGVSGIRALADAFRARNPAAPPPPAGGAAK